MQFRQQMFFNMSVGHSERQLCRLTAGGASTVNSHCASDGEALSVFEQSVSIWFEIEKKIISNW